MLIRTSNVMALSAFLGAVGCTGTAGDVETSAEIPGLEAQGGPSGSTGINGASPGAYQANLLKLIAAMGVAAANPNDPSLVNPALLATGLLNTSDGQQVFKYAIRCALPTGTQISRGGIVYQGGGILSTTSQWLTDDLTTPQKEDVLTCIVAHLNPFGAHVPIFLSGPSVTVMAGAEPNGFSHEEAIWQVKIPPFNQAPIHYAWPRVNLLQACGLIGDLSWITRLCGSALNTCGVYVRYDSAFVCTGSNGSFFCNGKPAITTTLKEGDLCANHIAL